jgi:mRNA interferase RelE/StbE
LAPSALASLDGVGNRKVRGEIAKVIGALVEQPAGRGKRLEPPLEALYSARAANERYRILYEVDEAAARVTVLFVGRRLPGTNRDVYAIAARLLATLLGKGAPPGSGTG